ncbi:endonuclease/exonuclease/phosphatase family protein [Mycolicibacterium litorale]|uniref:endonuclease/exonuclease/phosphatase family protein n=1 Tax=Mycolicibacterium litorale TaxID=758802 RepID=UPI0039A1ADE1
MSRKSRRRLTAWSAAALLCSAISLLARTLPLPNNLALLAAVGSPYIPIIALLAFVMSILGRRALLAVAAVFVLTATVAVQVRWHYLGTPTEVGQHTQIRLISSNLRKGHADSPFFVDLARRNADVLTVSELTPEDAIRFAKEGINEAFPYSVLRPAAGAAGVGLWSRFPLAAVGGDAPYATMVAAQLQVPGVSLDPLVVSLHVINPIAFEFRAFTEWRTGIRDTKERLNQFADIAGAGAVIVGGDFNSTPDMRQFRDLLTDGYRDAVEQTGTGFAPTFPNNNWLPPLITIDHVLTRNAAVASIHTARMPGSDHRALLASVQVPLNPDQFRH